MIEAVVMKSYAYRIYLFGAALLVKLVTRAYVNGERAPKGPETRKRNAQAGRFEWIEAAVQQPAERATDCVVFLPGPEEILDVHQQIQTRSS